MSYAFWRDKKEEDGGGNVFQNLDMITLIQEARCFNFTPVNPRKCIVILSKILYLLNQGEKLSGNEATDLFFATTKLFQSKDVMLRRLVYLIIKELSCMAQDVIIVTSSLTKDMTGKQDMHRAAAIRTLCSITDSTMFQAIDRYMKQAIVDKNPAVSSAALVSAMHLCSNLPDVARRWQNEAQEAILSSNAMVSYHALGVIAGIRRVDRLSSVKLVTQLTQTHFTSPFTLTLLIRLAAKVTKEDHCNASEKYMAFIETCLQHHSEIVVYEAAHALINLSKTARYLDEAISVLQTFCGSPKATLRLAGARSFAKLTYRHPVTVTACTGDLENLISDPNRSVATLAVTTLLAIGAESSIDRLMKQISSFMSEISDEFKIVVVRAIRSICSKYPRKHHSLASFLAGMLRDEGGLQYKAAITDALIAIIKENSDAKEIGLAHLCEFIEDCEHTSLAVRILHVLGREGPSTLQPSKYIRYIYNRVILESGAVRAAAVSTVARFGAARPELLPNVKVLLARCQLDDDDEVRDRAICYNAILDSGNRQLINDFITHVSTPNVKLLERALRDHLTTKSEEPFDIDSLPRVEEVQELKETIRDKESLKPTILRENDNVNQIKVIPGIDLLGPLFKTCEAVEMTEPETEYRVSCNKYIYARHLVLQFKCLNTLSDHILEQVHVHLEPTPGYKFINEVPCKRLHYNKQENIFCVLEFPVNPIETLDSFGATLEFIVRNCDPTTGIPDLSEGYADIYPLEEIEIGCKDQFKIRGVPDDDWEESWERASTSAEACDTFELSQKDVGEASVAVCKHLGLSKSAIGIVSDVVTEIRGCGIWREGFPALLRARLVAAHGSVTMQLSVRSSRYDIATLLLIAVG